MRATNAISFDDAQACLLIDADSHCKIETRSFIGGAAMDHRARIVGVLLAAILLGTLQGCGSPPAVRAAEIRSTEAFTRDQIQRIAAQYRSILLRSGGTDVCEPRTEPDPGPPHQNWRRCYVTIEVTPYTSNGIEYCLARLPERIEFNDSDKKKLIVFELKPTVQGSGPYRFDDQVGIRLFTNAGGAVVKGKFGNGDNGSDTPSQFHVKNSHGVRGEALYLPVILQVNSNDEPLSVCAAADPKIVNN